MREVKVLKQLPWLILFLLLAAGVTLWLLFVAEQQTHVKFAFQNQVERLGDELLRSRLEGRLSPDALPAGVEIFAVYGPRGELVAAWGTGAPERIPLPPKRLSAANRLIVGAKDGWVDLVKVLQPLRPGKNYWAEDEDRGNADADMPMGPMGRRYQGFLFVRVSDTPLEGRLWVWRAGAVLGTAAWAGFIVFVGLLWFRTRRYQAALVQHRELLQFAEASRTLSHELQNPLAAILLQTALLKRSAGTEVPSEVAIIEEEAQRMSALVTRVREFLKDPKGLAESIDLADLVYTLRDRFAVEVTLSTEGKPPFLVRFDPHRLRSVVENLIKNAIESGPDPRPEVRLGRSRPGWLRLEVLDSGTGFSPETLKQALNPFFTTKTTGTGIGLSIADSFVRAAGGKLKLENRSEGGARVILDLPEVPVEGNA